MADQEVPGDAELVVLAAGGSEHAFRTLYRAYVRPVFWLAHGLVGNPADAEEVTQETFLVAWRKLPGLDLAGDSLLPWLATFVVLTICGERLELARLAMGPRAGTVLVLLASALTVAVVASLLWPEPGTALFGATLLALTWWIAAHDVARRTIRATGVTRLMAACMLAGYAWLTVAGAVWLLGPVEGAAYDAIVHAVFLGFTISMIMAHAPVILPAVLRRPLPYHPVLYVPAGLLHASLLLRLWLGDAHGWTAAWRWGGVLNIVALLLFVLLAAGSAAAGSAPTGRSRPAAGRLR